MTKNELVQVISEKTGIKKDVVKNVLEEINLAIIKSLKKGDFVKISGFGTFYTMDTKAKKARNPKSGEVVEIPSRKLTKFRASKNIKVVT
jgi:nucleoid DNA-binding protein